MTFQELGVRDDLLRAISDLGYLAPMPVQERVIPHLLNEDSDVVALAQTGTGKTAAFGLPTLQRVDTSSRATQALILDPTRELCLQTASDLADYAKYIDRLSILPVYGGSSIESQIKALSKGVQIIVATPGRLLDLIKRKKVKLDDVNTVILDEADEMLNMGFVDDINEILTHVPEQRKMLLFSATMPKEIAAIASNYMHNPQEFVIGTRNEGSSNVRHIYYMVRASDKYLALKRIVDARPRIYGIIFTRTRAQAKEIADSLIQDGYNADALHGDLSQAQRDAVMKKFRERNLQLLVATDVAARGLDVDDLTHIISYALPDDNDIYNHRSGRTGRAGKTGTSICIIHSRERGKLKDIERHIGKPFERREVPKPEEIIEKQLFTLADRLEKVQVQEDEIAAYLPGVLKKLSWLSGEDLLKRLLSLEFNRLLDYYRDAPVLDYVPEKKERKKGEEKPKRTKEEKDSRVAEKGYERVYINLGKADGFFAPDLIRLINQNTRGQHVGLGRIDLLSYYSLFDVRQGDAHRVISALKNADFYGKRLFLEMAVEGKDYATMSWEKIKVKRNRAERRRAEREAREADQGSIPRRKGRSGKPRPRHKDRDSQEQPFARFRKKK
ncbi:MAG: DEAD/DEAH box helicase [Muribaculaceae bacterium]|nr:DEAD/DEAH box helicase [Muribaculaceae bacterium]